MFFNIQATFASHFSICSVYGSDFPPFALQLANSTFIALRSLNEKSLSCLPRNVLLLLDVEISCNAADLITLRVFL